MVEEKSFFEELAADKPESFEEEVFVINKSKKPIYIGMFMVFVLFIVFAITLMNRVEMPDMDGWNISEVNSWTKKNKITMIGKQSYSLEVDNDLVINQGIEAGKKIRKKSSLEIEFSKGPDPDESLEFPSVKKMSLEEIREWIKTNKLQGINIQYDNSNSIEKNTVISYKFVDGEASSFKRKNRVKIIVSKGPAELTETLSMPELYGKNKSEVLKWAADNKIQIEIKEAYSDYIPTNSVVSQNIPKDNKFNRSEKVIVVISIGEAIIVPDFSSLTSSEATSLASLYDLRLFVKSIDSQGEADRIVYQSIEAGAQAKKNDIVTLHVTKKSTRIKLPDFVGLKKSEASELATAYNIKVAFMAVDHTGDYNKVLSQSISKDLPVTSDQIVYLEISNGQINVPDFSGMTREKAKLVAEDLGLKVVFNEVIDVHRKNDSVIRQDLSVDSLVDYQTRLTLDLSKNKGVKIIDLTTMTKSEAEFWAKTKGYALRIIDVYNEKIDKHTLFDQNYTNIYLPENEAIVIYHSLGKVRLGNMIGQNKQDIETWLEDVNSKGANISVEYRNVTSSVYAKDTISNQSPKNKTIDLDAKVIFTISSSKILTEKSQDQLDHMTEADFIKWCGNNNISYKIRDAYSSSVKIGYIFGDALKSGVAKGKILNVYKSVGPVQVTSFVGQAKSNFEEWLSNVNNKQGDIKVTYVIQNGGVKDQIVSQSITSGILDTGSTITVTISSGL